MKPSKENQRESDKLQCKYETIVILSDGNVTTTLTLDSFIGPILYVPNIMNPIKKYIKLFP